MQRTGAKVSLLGSCKFMQHKTKVASVCKKSPTPEAAIILHKAQDHSSTRVMHNSLSRLRLLVWQDAKPKAIRPYALQDQSQRMLTASLLSNSQFDSSLHGYRIRPKGAGY